jgi:hypothetical protein
MAKLPPRAKNHNFFFSSAMGATPWGVVRPPQTGQGVAPPPFFFFIYLFIYLFILNCIILLFLYNFLYSAMCQPQQLTRGKPLILG